MILNHNTAMTILLYFEIHGEYVGVLEDAASSVSGKDWVHVSVLFDFTQMTDTAEMWDAKRDNGDVSDSEYPDLVHETFDNLFPDLRKELDIDVTDFGRVWMLQGTLVGLERAFLALAKAVDCRPSGDDDVFDYWPNAMRMFHAMAIDLDEAHRREVLLEGHVTIYNTIRDRNIPESYTAEEIGLP